MHINTIALAKGKSERVLYIERMIAKLEEEANYLLATIEADEKEGITVPSDSERRIRIDEIMDEMTDLINEI